jgi:hypothetical protein
MLARSQIGVAAYTSILWGVLFPATVRANIGERWWGDPAAEPRGLKEVAITHEKLTIDMRPLAALQPVQLEAIYSLHNPGTAKEFDLVFVSGAALTNDFEIRLDGRLLESRTALWRELAGPYGDLPAPWKPPTSMRGIGGETAHFRPAYFTEEATLLVFSVVLPPGPSTLTARGRAKACGADEQYPTATWVVPYLLAPAREWGSFGGLEVTAFVPEGWPSTCTLPLEREGSVLHGTFTALPADNLLLAARSPVGPWFRSAIYGGGVLYILAVLSGGALCWRAGYWHGYLLVRRRRASDLGWIRFAIQGVVLLILPAFGWAAFIYLAMPLSTAGLYGALAGQESPYFHEHLFLPGCLTLLLMALVVPAGLWIAHWSARRYCRQAS